jgi:two-component system chemotaxis response regulator CheY
MTDAVSLDTLNILVVDDDETMRNLVCRMLKRMKVAGVVEANGGQQALERLEQTPAKVDLVICDWNMPGMTGMELFQKVHSTKPMLPFLMLTGRADLDSVVAAKKAGVPGYIVKPISPQELKTKITYLVSNGAGHA